MLGVGTLETCFMGANAPPPVLQGCGGTVSEMTYSVSSGTINPSIPYHTDARPLCCKDVVDPINMPLH